ncbi:glycosyltransferase family 4 protein [uncultured Roseobacter sp.]|uniref:glycosyltransferase family 4 protein n=1 Tax=uncultured Roseobacter sp. TaxID=114847 RepID=UPI002602CE1C|nr:glycosyltransferase family 4 protein [uncultured Roseobacter sp.]
MTRSATFAIPGDIETLTGGYIYEKQLLLGLRRLGWDIAHLQLPDGFPDPTEAAIDSTARALAGLPSNRPVILDGFLTGAMPPDRLSETTAPIIAVTHHPLAYETGLSPERSAHLKHVERANLARASHIVVPSPHTARILIDDFGVAADRITIAPPGVTRAATEISQPAKPPEILAVGQLVRRKGHDTLLRALSRLKDLPWTAHIVGRESDPVHGTELKHLALELGLEERLYFNGELSPDALRVRYATASIFALATRYEGYGMVFAEAMAHGLPIVTCGGGAVPDTVPVTAGRCVRVGDAVALSAALRELLTDAPLRKALATGSRRHGESLPTWDDTARVVSDLLHQLSP